MKLTLVTQPRKKSKPIVRILLLTIFLGGCGLPIKQESSLQACREAEQVVQNAQQESDQAIGNLSKAKDENSSKTTAVNLQSLQEAEEKAFEKCYKSK